jgi:acetylornithine deacetylase/succinyl-diaminopimelate desuccinylase-like protein
MQSHLEDLFAILRFPSISTASEHASDVRDCGQWLLNKLNSIGLKASLHETSGHPVVLAQNEHQEGRLNLLIYGHYDVQPVDPLNLWDTPPFEPMLKDGRIWARGATDNKGQLMAHVLGVQSYLEKNGTLPLNLTFLLEGEEEIGSPNLAPFIEQNKELLACDVIAVSDTGMVARGVPCMGYGLRGIYCCEVKVTGPSKDLHSGVYGGAIANPAAALARIVASLHHEDGSIAIDGFFEDVIPLAEWERQMWGKIDSVKDEKLLEITGSPEAFGEPGFTAIERIWGRPTAEVNGLGSGYQGEGSKTVLPAKAMAKFSFRLVAGQDPNKIAKAVERHILKHTPKGVHVEFIEGHSGKPYYSDPHSDYGKAGQMAVEKAFGKAPVLIREGGSIPIIQDMKEILGADSLMLGLALPDCQIHAPNENYYLENFEAGIRLSQILIDELAALRPM